MKRLIISASIALALTTDGAIAQGQIQSLEQLDIAHPIWDRGQRETAPTGGRLLVTAPSDYRIESPSVRHERQGVYSVIPRDSATNFSLSVPWRESTLTAREVHLVDGYVLARELVIQNSNGAIKAADAFIPLRLLEQIGMFLDRVSFDETTDEQASEGSGTIPSSLAPVLEPVILSGFLVEMAPIAHPERPDQAFSSLFQAEHASLSDIRYTPSNRRLSFTVGNISARSLYGEAATRGGARFSLDSLDLKTSGDIEALSPRKLIELLDLPTLEEGGPIAASEGYLDIQVEDLRIDSLAADVSEDLELASARLRVSLDADARIEASGNVVDLELDPRIFEGTPAFSYAERIANAASMRSSKPPRVQITTTFSGNGRPGWVISGSGSLAIPGALSLYGFTGLDLADGTYAAIKEDRRAALLNNLVETGVSSTKISVRDLGLSSLLQEETGRTLKELVEETVIARAGEGIGGDFRTMAIQLALGQVTPIVELLQNEGSLEITLDTKERVALALALVQLFASAQPTQVE